MTAPEGLGVPWRQYAAYGVETLPVRVLGAALMVVAGRPWAGLGGIRATLLFCCAVAFALWAAPGPDRRPSVTSTRWSYRLARHRTTVLACGAVLLAAMGGPPPAWQGAAVALLLTCYLVASEPRALRSARGRALVEIAGAGLGAGLVLVASVVPVDAYGAGRVVAAVLVAGAAAGGVLTVMVRGRGGA